jgi:hypothetical protein
MVVYEPVCHMTLSVMNYLYNTISINRFIQIIVTILVIAIICILSHIHEESFETDIQLFIHYDLRYMFYMLLCLCILHCCRNNFKYICFNDLEHERTSKELSLFNVY